MNALFCLQLIRLYPHDVILFLNFLYLSNSLFIRSIHCPPVVKINTHQFEIMTNCNRWRAVWRQHKISLQITWNPPLNSGVWIFIFRAVHSTDNNTESSINFKHNKYCFYYQEWHMTDLIGNWCDVICFFETKVNLGQKRRLKVYKILIAFFIFMVDLPLWGKKKNLCTYSWDAYYRT